MMTLYYTPRACSVAAHIAIRRAKLPCSFMEISKEARSSPDFRRVHPLGKVPALDLGDGIIITELGAILTLVGELSPTSGLLPSDRELRARCFEWVSFFTSEFHPTVSRCFHPERFVSDEGAQKLVSERAMEQVKNHFDLIERRLPANGYSCGEHFTIADAVLVVIFAWMVGLKIHPKKYERLMSWAGRVWSVPEAQEAFQVEGIPGNLGLLDALVAQGVPTVSVGAATS